MFLKQPLVLCILDGWGIRSPHQLEQYDGIFKAYTPHWDRFLCTYPWSKLQASGPFVGLPVGQMGNSEVGHMTIGLGRVVKQEMVRINETLLTHQLQEHPLWKKFACEAKTCHVLGLLSDGGVHSHIQHFISFCQMLEKEGSDVKVHAFLDGRDSPTQSAKDYLKLFINQTSSKFYSLGGRFFGMDRDQRWERIEKAYKAIAEGKAFVFDDPFDYIQQSYDQSDEFIEPAVLRGYQGIEEKDSLLILNFRGDRIQQILKALLDPTFSFFKREKHIRFQNVLGVTDYTDELKPFMSSLFSKQSMSMGLGETLSKLGLKQLRIVETEKYAHVTYFFNGGRETAFEGEDRCLISSPNVATYDLKPEMSADDVLETFLKALKKNQYAFIIMNFANPDMVGHTAILPAIQKAIEKIDECLGKIEKACFDKNYTLIITADHGNAECTIDPKSLKPHTSHTLNDVPFVVINAPEPLKLLEQGCLSDVAPTVLKLMGFEKPLEMTGKVLCIR